MSKQQTLRDALRAKFRTPREAIKALGLDERLLEVPRMALDSGPRPNRLQYLLVTRAARIFNPQLATDAQVDYGTLFKGVNTRNLAGRRATILKDAARMLRGKTITEDASLQSLAHLLDMFEHVKEPKSLDESVSEPQHNAMAAAAGGQSNLGIPKEVGEEFMKKDDEDEDEEDAHDEDDEEDREEEEGPENALDDEVEPEEEDPEGEGEEEREEANDEDEEHEDEDEKVTKGAMDQAIYSAVESAVMAERKRGRAASHAREFVRPYVGELPMGLDSAEEILRSAALALNIDGAARVHPSALKTLIKVCGRPAGAHASESAARLAHDSIVDGLELFPEARRIGNA